MTPRAATLLAAAALLAPATASADEALRASRLYKLHCSGCHGLDGAGSRTGRVPKFPGIVRHFLGAQDGRRYLVLVPGVANAALSNEDAAAVLNYVLAEWGDGAAFSRFTSQEVAAIRTATVRDILALRRAIAIELAGRNISIAY